ncbi:MAG: bifunctional metallophosphatase/5'-nucleotidase [Myxococcales bacterium]|nr:bifunctional metallophosphatase/5'-nucleotidase [Myxococcales bacterium]
MVHRPDLRPSYPTSSVIGQHTSGLNGLVALTAAIAMLSISGCGGAPKQAQSVLSADKINLKDRCLLLTTNDSEAHFDGRKEGRPPALKYVGTITRIAAEKKRLLRQRKGAVLLVSAGDVLQGRYMARTDKDRKRAAKEAWLMYERAGYDVGVLGNHEFDAGPGVLRHAMAALKTFRIVTSNLDPASPSLDNRDGKLYSTTLIKTCGGLRIGFFGLLTPSTRVISDFGDTRMSHPNDPINTPARLAVAALRKQRVDVIVALTHLGYEKDRKLAREVRGIDVIVGGHSHTLLKEWKKVGETLVVQTGERFGHLGYLELVGRKGGGLITAKSSWRAQAIDRNLPRDPAVARSLQDFRGAYAPERVVGERTVPWSLRGAGRKPYGRRVARAVTAHLMRRYRVDGAILNMGGLRTNTVYPKGPVTDLEIRAIHPFGNRLVRLTATGAQLRQILEQACTKGHRGKLGERVALHGITMRCDGQRAAIAYTKKDGKVIAVASPGARVQDLRIAGMPVDLKKTYYIATNDYMARGGSGYWLMTQLKRACADETDFKINRCKSSPTLADVVEESVKQGSFDGPLHR